MCDTAKILVDNLFLKKIFRSVLPFYSGGKHQKTFGFIMFSGGLEREDWAEMD